ncbi:MULTISPECIES: hypothetical protein [unclassified Rickettsia]
MVEEGKVILNLFQDISIITQNVMLNLFQHLLQISCNKWLCCIDA